MKKLSNVFIIIGILLILLPVAGEVYTSYKQDGLIKAAENSSQDAGEQPVQDIIDEYEVLGRTFENSINNSQNSGAVTSPVQLPVESQQPKAVQKSSPKAIGVLKIDKIDIKLPVLEGVGEDSLSLGAGHIPGTAGIGEIGNCALAGHRSFTFGSIFNRLDEIGIGDEIVLTASGKAYTYTVYEKKVVEPTDTSVLNRNSAEKRLTLITCHPPKQSTYRLIIHARINEDNTEEYSATP